MIKLSIVVPVYNVENYLARCVASLLKIDSLDVEIILVDDGSTDSSGKLCDTFRYNESVKVIHKKNGGLSDARNEGLNIAKGEYVWFVDSDDSVNFSYSSFLSIIEAFEPDVVCANYIILNNNKVTNIIQECLKKDTLYLGKEALKTLLYNHQYYVAAWKNIFRREFLIKNNLYFKKGIFHEDEQLTPYIFLQAKKVVYFDDFIYVYHIREDSISNNKKWNKNIEDIFTVFYENASYFKKNISENRLMRMLLNDIVEKMIYHINKHNVPNNKASMYISKKFLINNAYGIKNRLRVFVYLLMPKVYQYIFWHNEKRK